MKRGGTKASDESKCTCARRGHRRSIYAARLSRSISARVKQSGRKARTNIAAMKRQAWANAQASVAMRNGWTRSGPSRKASSWQNEIPWQKETGLAGGNEPGWGIEGSKIRIGRRAGCLPTQL